MRQRRSGKAVTAVERAQAAERVSVAKAADGYAWKGLIGPREARHPKNGRWSTIQAAKVEKVEGGE